jgi:hypothetical protein
MIGGCKKLAAGDTLDSKLCQYMLCQHGVYPTDVLNRSLKEKLLMWELIKKEAKEVKHK